MCLLLHEHLKNHILKNVGLDVVLSHASCLQQDIAIWCVACSVSGLECPKLVAPFYIKLCPILQ